MFVDAEPPQILEIAAQLGLRHVQLNGDETPEDVRGAARRCSVIKAIRVDARTFAADARTLARRDRRAEPANLAGFVLETGGTRRAGRDGRGERLGRRSATRQRAGAFDGLPPLIAAGGLTPENVGEVVRDRPPVRGGRQQRRRERRRA